MPRSDKSSKLQGVVRVIVALTILVVHFATAYSNDGYYNYLGNHPEHATLDWSDDVQGIAHSDDHWYITNGNDEVSGLFKIHVSVDLASGSYSGYQTPMQSGLTSLFGFIKFKALDSYLNPHDGRWYLVIGAEGGGNSGIAIYDEALRLVGGSLWNQSSTGWVAVDSQGFLYSSVNGSSNLWRYTLDWAALAGQGIVYVDPARDTVPLRDERGSPLALDRLQGGAFTPEGNKLYIVTGFFGELTAPHGIHAFDVTDPSLARRVRKSTQDGLFRFQWNPNCGLQAVCEEPEGLTFWDLTDGRAPNVGGELHVLLLDNDASTDEVYLKHYTKGIYVDGASPSGNGDPTLPLPMVQSGIDLAFDDMEIRIASGSYPEVLTLSRSLRLVRSSDSGVVTIGP